MSWWQPTGSNVGWRAGFSEVSNPVLPLAVPSYSSDRLLRGPVFSLEIEGSRFISSDLLPIS